MKWKVGSRQRFWGHGERAKAATCWWASLAAVVILFGVKFGALERAAHADPAEVESLIAQGNDLRRHKRDAESVPLFKKAFDMEQTPRTAGQLGLAELAASYPVEAADHLALALESPDHPWVASNLQSLKDMLTKARDSIGEVTVGGTPAGAAVFVNGRPIGALPLPAAVRVAAGRVEISLTASGYAPLKRVLQVTAKQTEQVDVALARVHSLDGTPADPPIVPTITIEEPEKPASARSGLRIAAWVTAGAAVVSLGGGVAFQLAHNADIDSFKNQHCDPVTPSPGQCQDLAGSWSGERAWSLAGYIGGGVLAVTSAVLFFSSSSDNGKTGATHARVECAPAFGAFLCRGEF